MCEIQRRYINAQYPTDTTQPLIRFYEAITNEYAMLQRYAFVCDSINWLYLYRISWYDEKLYKMVERRLQRLEILWHIFVSWLAEHNIDQNIKSSLVTADISNYHQQTASLLQRTHFCYLY